VRQSSDAIGLRGEFIFAALITTFGSNGGRLFRPQFLGDKAHFVDFIVFLDEPDRTHLFFLVQVKATRAGYTSKERRLKVQISEQHIRELALCPAPTYVVGIDDEREVGYLVSVDGRSRSALSSMSTSHPLNHNNRERLRQEVVDFWQQTSQSGLVSLFQDDSGR